MKRTTCYSLVITVILLVAGVSLVAGDALATPAPNGAKLYLRYFNDCPGTILTATNRYPQLINISEAKLTCSGGANLHNWDFSVDGGASSAVFNNADSFRFGATLILNNQRGPGVEGGLRISPWWDQFANGYFNVRLDDGEIACFGGVLPFFSFTSAFGILYEEKMPIRLEIIYRPHSNTADDDATIEYSVLWKNVLYSSGPLYFSDCIPGLEANGCFGIGDDARVGGRIQTNFFAGVGAKSSSDLGTFLNIFYEALPQAIAGGNTLSNGASGAPAPAGSQPPTPSRTWGRLKATYR